MEIFEVKANEFDEAIKNPYHIFCKAAFNDLNKDKCDKIFYLLFRDGKYRLGIIGGTIDNNFNSSFSAPFGGFSFISPDIRLQYIEEAIKVLDLWAVAKDFRSVCITLPPQVYGGSFISKQINCLWRAGYEITQLNLNYAFNLDSLNEKYQGNIWYNARKNLKISLNSGLKFLRCTDIYEKRLAYDIIIKNRERRGHPMRMSWDQIMRTTELIPADFFLIFARDHLPAASAIVFDINPECVRVIYWGELEGFTELKVMNYLSFKIFEYYKSLGKKVVELGISTENSVPNYGLCEFKEGIGCQIEPALTLTRRFK